nr:lipoyl domain-containing protein [Natrinema sp. SYSU A 869]
MGYIVRMPKLGLEMERGTLLEWAVDEGTSVSEGDLLAEVESEKSVADVEAREDGVLRRMYLEVDESVPPGTPIGIVAPPESDISELEAEATADLEANVAVEDEIELGGDERSVGSASGGSGSSARGGRRRAIARLPPGRESEQRSWMWISR